MNRTRSFVAFLLIVSLMIVSSIGSFAISKKEMTKQNIRKRFEVINSSYEVGEPFSKEDAEFVKKYAFKVDQNLSTKTSISITSSEPSSQKDFDVNGSSSDGSIEANCKGNMWQDLNTFTHSFGADFTTTITKGGEVTEIKNEVSEAAYGIVGSDGLIGKIYEQTLTSTGTDTTSWSIDETEAFSGAVILGYVTAKATISYDGGSFSINM